MPKFGRKEENLCSRTKNQQGGVRIVSSAFMGWADTAAHLGMPLARMLNLPSKPRRTHRPADVRTVRMGGTRPASVGVPAIFFKHLPMRGNAEAVGGMELDYFYGRQAEQFTFYRVPKAILFDRRFDGVSADAKLLYGILLDRMSLSLKNNWLDERGRVYIIFTMDEVMQALGCAGKKATRLMEELEHKAGLIERKRRGLGKPNLIYLKNFATLSKDEPQKHGS